MELFCPECTSDGAYQRGLKKAQELLTVLARVVRDRPRLPLIRQRQLCQVPLEEDMKGSKTRWGLRMIAKACCPLIAFEARAYQAELCSHLPPYIHISPMTYFISFMFHEHFYLFARFTSRIKVVSVCDKLIRRQHALAMAMVHYSRIFEYLATESSIQVLAMPEHLTENCTCLPLLQWTAYLPT